MSTVPPNLRYLAQRLLACESTRLPSLSGSPCRTLLVCEKFKGCLARLGGLAGFRSLLSRALALAKAEVGADCLGEAVVLEDGAMSGLGHSGQVATLAEEALVANLLNLLVTFIGEPLTRQLVRDSWPDVPGLASAVAPENFNGEQNER